MRDERALVEDAARAALVDGRLPLILLAVETRGRLVEPECRGDADDDCEEKEHSQEVTRPPP